MRVVSFSLYGDKPLYLMGAIRNARSVGTWYPGWACWFYVGKSVPCDVREQLEAAGARVVYLEEPEAPSAMLWRFRPAHGVNVKALIVRDCDSQFSLREQTAVSQWLAQGKSFHIMRDHPAHRVPILGGMWGAVDTGISAVRNALAQPLSENIYGIDQFLLARHVYPYVKKDACIHDAYFCYESHSKPFPSPRKDYGFVGEVVSPEGQPNREQREEVRHADTSLVFRLRLKASSIKDRLLQKNYWGALP